MDNQESEVKEMTKKERREQKKIEQREASQAAARKAKARSAMIWGGAFVVLILAVWGLVKVSGPSTDQPQLSTTEVLDSEHAKGPSDAPVTIIEYSDFQCPACKQYAPVVKQIIENYPNEVQFVYRHYPLRTIHAQAQVAAEASEAAGMQGKFFEFHDILFANQNAWIGSNSSAKKIFIEYAVQLELDVEKFEADMNSAAARDKVNNDYSSGTQSGVTGTPSFFMNGTKIQNPRGFEPFRLLIDAELERLGASSDTSDISDTIDIVEINGEDTE